MDNQSDVHVDDRDSTSSEDEVLNPKQLIAKIGFNPTGTRNYLFTIFNRKTSVRTILFGGATPFHTASNNIANFFEHYISNGTTNQCYDMSVILDTKNLKKETDTLTLVKLEPSHLKSKRIKNCKVKFKYIRGVFDNIYTNYISNEGRFNYRTYVGFKEFTDARFLFRKQMVSLNDVLNGTVSSSETIVNTAS